jgi:hypothetical protein
MADTQNRKINAFILLSGILTSAACLVLVYFASKAGFEIMGLYVAFLIPMGALLVGIASGSGYAIASKLFNVKIQKAYFIAFFIVALITYVGALYATYLSVVGSEEISSNEITFLRYFTILAENTTYSINHGKDALELGKFGYLFQFLEAVGFSLGALLPAYILSKSFFCSICQLYMKPVAKGKLPSVLTRDDLKHKNRAGRLETLAASAVEAKDKYEAIKPKIAEATKTSLGLTVAEHPVDKKDARALSWVLLELFQCPQCEEANLKATLFMVAEDNKIRSALLETVNRK